MKILFATLPMDGHFNPLTGIAMYLKSAGHDVRWYTGARYAARLERLGIPHYPFQRATEIDQDNFSELFPERARLHGPALIKFDGKQVFVANIVNYYEDVREIDATFPFDALFCDAAFYAIQLIKEKLGKRVYSVGVGPSIETSPDFPPNFMGMKPARSALGKKIQQGMRVAMDKMVMDEVKGLYDRMVSAQGIEPFRGSLFDISYRCVDALFQSGVPGFQYPRRDPNPRVKFVGALLPYKAVNTSVLSHPEKLDQYSPVILISQGTIDNRDPNKLIVPALEALKDSRALLIVTTSHRNTAELRKAYPQDNVIIEDYVDFDSVLERTDLFICNGGYGSILLSLSKGVPVLTAGIKEGKNDVNAHVDYFGVGIDLRTENPKPADLRRAAGRILSEPRWKQNVARLRDELQRYQPNELIAAHLVEDLGAGLGAGPL